MKKLIATVCIIFWCPMIALGEYYQWVDENGVLRFGDSPAVDDTTPGDMEIKQMGKETFRLGGGAVDSQCIEKLKTICIQMKDTKGGLFSQKLSAFKDECEPEPIVNAVFDVLQYGGKDGRVIKALSDVLPEYVRNQPETAYALIRGLENESPLIQELSKDNLRIINHKGAIQPIVNALKVKPEPLREILVDCLFSYYTLIEYEPAAVPDLIALARNESNIEIKKQLVEFLGWSKNPEIVDSMGYLLSSSDNGLKAKAAFAIAMANPKTKYTPDLEAELIRGLEIYGDSDMAYAFINYGTEKMDKAGWKWANENGYTVKRFYP